MRAKRKLVFRGDLSSVMSSMSDTELEARCDAAASEAEE